MRANAKRQKKCKRCGVIGDVVCIAAHECIVRYPDSVQQALERLWFVFGNNGPKSTMGNHKFIQRHVEGRSHEARYYKPTMECREEVNRAIDTMKKGKTLVQIYLARIGAKGGAKSRRKLSAKEARRIAMIRWKRENDD